MRRRTRKFNRASLNFSYSQSVSPGNGVYLTSNLNEMAALPTDYTGIRKVNLSVSGGYYELSSLGQGIAPYRTATGGAGMTYSLPWSLHFVARYDYRYQKIENIAFIDTGYSGRLWA